MEYVSEKYLKMHVVCNKPKMLYGDVVMGAHDSSDITLGVMCNPRCLR